MWLKRIQIPRVNKHKAEWHLVTSLSIVTNLCGGFTAGLLHTKWFLREQMVKTLDYQRPVQYKYSMSDRRIKYEALLVLRE